MSLYIPIKQECCPQVQKTLPPPHLCCPTSTYLPVSAPIPLVTGSFPAWYSHHILLFSVIGLNSQWSEHLMTCDFPPEDYPLWRHDSHPCCSLLYPWCLALCLIQSRCSENIPWMDESPNDSIYCWGNKNSDGPSSLAPTHRTWSADTVQVERKSF